MVEAAAKVPAPLGSGLAMPTNEVGVMSAIDRPIRILFVLAEGEERDLLLLAQALDPVRYASNVIAFSDMLTAAYPQVARGGIAVDYTPAHLSPDGTIAYLASRLPAYDLVVSGHAVAAVQSALKRLHLRPPLIAYPLRADFDPSAPFEASPVADVVRRWEALFAEVLAERPSRARSTGLFRSFLQGGFECSTHRRAHDRARIDVVAASHHDVHAEHDYSELARHGIVTVRDGLRWHLIEREPGRYDWSSLEAQLAAARSLGTEVIWDLLHYGWPDDIDIWTPAFVERFAAFAQAAARHIGPAGPDERRFYAPVNEISFFAWGGGDVGYLNPFARDRGHELKVQLARASIAAMEAILAIDPAARFVHADPVINVIADPAQPNDTAVAEGHRLAQFQGWDLIAGEVWPQIGGRPELLDIVGVNFYRNNQWVHGGAPLAWNDPLARPFRDILAETYARYGRPIFVAETGIEGDERPAWLRMILAEVRAAVALGVPVEGVCLYPVLDHPGWDDDRYCPNGLLGHSVHTSERVAHAGLAAVIETARHGVA